MNPDTNEPKISKKAAEDKQFSNAPGYKTAASDEDRQNAIANSPQRATFRSNTLSIYNRMKDVLTKAVAELPPTVIDTDKKKSKPTETPAAAPVAKPVVEASKYNASDFLDSLTQDVPDVSDDEEKELEKSYGAPAPKSTAKVPEYSDVVKDLEAKDAAHIKKIQPKLIFFDKGLNDATPGIRSATITLAAPGTHEDAVNVIFVPQFVGSSPNVIADWPVINVNMVPWDAKGDTSTWMKLYSPKDDGNYVATWVHGKIEIVNGKAFKYSSSASDLTYTPIEGDAFEAVVRELKKHYMVVKQHLEDGTYSHYTTSKEKSLYMNMSSSLSKFGKILKGEYE